MAAELNEKILIKLNALQHNEIILVDAVNLHNEFANALNPLSFPFSPSLSLAAVDSQISLKLSPLMLQFIISD